jgi:HK97 gp10 family phage protein
MPNVTVKTQILYNNLPSIIKDLRADSAMLSYRTAETIKADARRNVHVITGNLRDSIVREKVKEKHHRIVVGMSYGAFEEYGTRFRPAHPFLRPAVERARAEFRMGVRKLVHR